MSGLHLKTVTGVRQIRWWRAIHNVDVTWDRQTGADGYEYKLETDSGKLVAQMITPLNTVTFKVDNKLVYKVSVRAYRDVEGVRMYSGWSTTCYCMTQPAKKDTRELDAKVKRDKFRIKWEKVRGLDGYNVFVTTDKGGAFDKAKTVGPDEKAVFLDKVLGKKVRDDKIYFVYVEGFKNVDGVIHTTGLNYITKVKKKKVEVLYYETDWK